MRRTMSQAPSAFSARPATRTATANSGDNTFAWAQLCDLRRVGKEWLATWRDHRAKDALRPGLPSLLEENLNEAELSGVSVGKRCQHREERLLAFSDLGERNHELAGKTELDRTELLSGSTRPGVREGLLGSDDRGWWQRGTKLPEDMRRVDFSRRESKLDAPVAPEQLERDRPVGR